MTHQVLQGLGIHTGPCHVAAVGMTAYVRRDIRKLDLVDIIIAVDHVVESMLPVHSHQGHAIIVYEEEATISIDHLLIELRLPSLFYSSERGSIGRGAPQ